MGHAVGLGIWSCKSVSCSWHKELGPKYLSSSVSSKGQWLFWEFTVSKCLRSPCVYCYLHSLKSTWIKLLRILKINTFFFFFWWENKLQKQNKSHSCWGFEDGRQSPGRMKWNPGTESAQDLQRCGYRRRDLPLLTFRVMLQAPHTWISPHGPCSQPSERKNVWAEITCLV